MATAALRVEGFRMTRKASRKAKRTKRPNEAERIAHAIGLPASQRGRGDLEAVDVANYSEADQRSMVRSGERRTIRRTPKVVELYNRKIIDRQELDACKWYADAHAARYDTTGITANLGGTGGRSSTNFDHLPKTREQEQAFRDFEFARAGIHPVARAVFERVVLYNGPIPRLTLTFKLAIRQLIKQLGGRLGG